jgi:hypothetical protein
MRRGKSPGTSTSVKEVKEAGNLFLLLQVLYLVDIYPS